ncbi:MAG TPA: 3-methyl-2-oxobutanoate dehydrogenase subunit beta, partial [Desulfosporosinus sp.]|nr:3-methyl-2-oxobutanoate dehydrogenase subunit beta [Desulfosporosinus sp.]
APATIQEMVDLMGKAFDLVDEYRNPVMILGDGILGQMMEGVEFPAEETQVTIAEKPWATTGAKGRRPNVINSLFLDPVE